MIPLMKTAFTNEQETCNKLADFIRTVPKLSLGEKCFEFEREFAKFQGCKHAVLVNSGASANFLLLQVLKNLGKIKDNDNVGFSALTWATNVMPIMQLGFNPVPVDCTIQILNVMSYDLEEAIKKYNLKAFFSTNVLGFAGDLDEIKRVCEKHGVLFIEDNCESLGTELQGIKTGNFGLASTFSFFVAHHMSTIEGGMICTNDDELAMNLIMSRANGWDRNLTKEQQEILRSQYGIDSEFYSKYAFYDIGMNVRPIEITGFIGLEQLKCLQHSIETRQKQWKRLKKVIEKSLDFVDINDNHLSFVSNFSIPIVCSCQGLRNKYYNIFKNEVEIRPLIAGNITKQPFWKKYITTQYELPNTDYLHDNAFYFGNYEGLSEEDLLRLEELLLNE